MRTVSKLFEQTFENLRVTNSDEIAKRRDQITKALNKHFRDTDSASSNRLMVGSYGRNTAINGVSDLDMLYVLPSSLYTEYHQEKGTTKALSAVREGIAKRYSTTNIRVDRLVVVVQFTNFKFEVQPVFEASDGSFFYPDTYSDSWKKTMPRDEIKAMAQLDEDTRGNARKLCRLARAWKQKHDAPLNGLLIDTLVWKFLTTTEEYDSATSPPDLMVRDFFEFLNQLPKQDSFNALGSNQRVHVKKNFQAKAGKAHQLCIEAIDAEGTQTMHSKWKLVFGRFVPVSPSKSAAAQPDSFIDTEEFIEDQYAVDLRYPLDLDCKITQDGFRPQWLRSVLSRQSYLRPQKTLEFIADTSMIPDPFELRWKVLNRGDEARRRNEIRGQIIKSDQRNKHTEHTVFRGEHLVECYAINGGTVIARERIDVPIQT